MMTMTRCSEPLADNRKLGWDGLPRLGSVLASALLGLCLIAGVAQGEGSADLVQRGKGYRAGLLASDPTLGILPPDGRETVSLHFVYLNEGEYLNMASSAQGIGQGKIVYRDPTGMSNRCDLATGYIENLSMEKAGPAAGTPCSVKVEPGLSGIWEVEFVPPSTDVDLARYEPVFSRDEWQPQTETDFWVRAWDVSVSKNAISEGGPVISGRTHLRTFAGIVSNEVSEGQPWNTIWFGRSSDGFTYALDTNGIKVAALNLLASTRGLKDAEGDSLYASATLDALGTRAFIADPYALSGVGEEQSLKLFYSRPDQSQPAESVSSLMGPEWLFAGTAAAQTMTELAFDPATNMISVTIEGEGLSNALELFDADDTGADGIAQFTYNNLPAGPSSLVLPAGLSGDLIGRFTSKVAEMHFPMANVLNSQTGLRVRRMNGPKDGTGDLYWNLGFEAGRFDGDLVNRTNSLRGVAGAWGPEQGLGRVNDVWTMSGVASELPLSVAAAETDLGLELRLASIEPGDGEGVQVAIVDLVLRNDGPSDTTNIRIDSAQTAGVMIESVSGAVLDDGAVLVDALPANQTATLALRVIVKSANDPLAMAVTGQALSDTNLVNDVGLLIFPEPPLQVAAPAPDTAEGEPQSLETLALEPIAELDEATAQAQPVADPANAVEPKQAAADTDEKAVVAAQLKTDLIGLRKRADGDQVEADVIFAISNTGTVALRDLSLPVSLRRHLGDAFVSIIGRPVFEIQPLQPGSWLALNPGYTGFPGADELFIPDGVLRPKDSALLRMTVHYDQDALEGIAPLSIRGDLLATVDETEYRFPSDNDFNKGEVDENGDGNPENDSTPLPGLRLVKSVDVLPGPAAFDGVDDAYDAVFGFRIENTGGLALQDLAMADLFLENEAVTEILDVEILYIEAQSESFTATGLPDAFVGLNNVQRFDGGEAVLQPGEEVDIAARVFFRLDDSKLAEPILNRAAAFARVDLDGDGELDTVLGDPADTNTTLGVDADGDGEEGNDAAPVGFGRLEVATVLSGEIKTLDGNDFLLLDAQTTVTNTGTATLGNITVDLPIPETLFLEFIDIPQPATVARPPSLGSKIVQPLTYDGVTDKRPIDEMPALLPGESFAFTIGYRFLADEIDPLALTQMAAVGEG
ncbi:MAG: hypothetical protein ACPG40_12890, partial [Alphaproteobacteria bacterium]